MLKAVWQRELNPGEPATLAMLIKECGLDADAVMKLGAEPRWAERREADTKAALARGVFGAPSYVIGDDIFWGQDRLEFVERRLARGPIDAASSPSCRCAIGATPAPAAQAAEAAGLRRGDEVELRHDPFTPLALAALATETGRVDAIGRHRFPAFARP